MKYGYLFYRKPLLDGHQSRKINLGDAIQSLAVLEIYRRLGIPVEDIVPLDAYDLADYNGEKVLLLLNGIESYEHYAYHSRRFPVSEKIIPVFVGICLECELTEKELAAFRRHQPIGCRNEATAAYLVRRSIDTFLSGCLTMVFPKREKTKRQNKVFLVDCSEELIDFIPEELRAGAVSLSQVISIHSVSTGNRLTNEEARQYMDSAKARLELFRDNASLVITSRLHAALPCAAMGIPVVLAKKLSTTDTSRSTAFYRCIHRSATVQFNGIRKALFRKRSRMRLSLHVGQCSPWLYRGKS